MGSCAAPSAKGDDKFITTDYLQQCRKKPPCKTYVSYSRRQPGSFSGVKDDRPFPTDGHRWLSLA
ncbi:hypothetical protein FU305_18005 [Salmonella enterica subsp. enterica]|nr:hypothetical protein [Salmonella enterica subsp. enterica]